MTEKPWSEKYRPKRLVEIVNQEEAKNKLLDFVKNFKKQRKKAILLYGPAGSGKTALVYALASEMNLEILELNASDFRNKQQIQDILGKALKQQSLFAKGKIILVDELEGISAQEDRGGLQELMKLIDEAPWPMILVCNNPWQEKFRPLLKKVEKAESKALDTVAITKILYKIASKEQVTASPNVLKKIAEMSKGDARAAINDLQILASIAKKIEDKDLEALGFRDKETKIYEALEKVFKTKEAKNAFDSVDLDLDQIFLWLDENLPLVYHGNELEKAYEILSLADLYRGRIRKRQHWRFLSYIYDFISEGIAVAKRNEKKEFFKYKQPTRPLKIWLANQKQAKKKEIAKKLLKKMHASSKEVMHDLEFLKIACKNKKFCSELVKEFQLAPEEEEWFKS
ncbi:MAG: replication factor C large subunit [Candidatus Pacearchaeota archaeon]